MLIRATHAVAIVIVLMVLTSGCFTDPDPGQSKPTASNSPSDTGPISTPTAEIDYSNLSEKMLDWENICDVVDSASIIDRFEANVTRTGSDDDFSDEPRRECWLDFEFPDGGYGNIIYFIDPRDTNIQAAGDYSDRYRSIIEMWHGTEPDKLIEIGDKSSWIQGHVGAYETPTDHSRQRKEALAVVLGDFYVISVLLSFYPEEAVHANCEPSADDDCLMTAEFMAEFMAEEYLPALHDSIEERLAGSD